MEPITHFLTGAVLARAGFDRKTALATATMTLAAEAPDLDVISGLKGPVYGFAHHRGFTHSFLGLFLVAGLTVGLMYLIWRLRGRKTNIPDLPPRWGLLFLFAYVAGLSHILLDFTNNYGVRPFWPFWEKWYSWDIVFIVEPALYVILIAGLALPAIWSRNQRLPRRQRAAILALACVVALYAARDYEHRQAVQAVRAAAFAADAKTGEAPMRASAYPYPLSLTRWYGVAEMPGFFASADVNSRTGRLYGDLQYDAKPPETPATLAAKRTYLGRVYLDWARYPLVTEAKEGEGEDTVVNFRDLRFAYPLLNRNGILAASVRLDGKLHVSAEAMGSRQESPPLN